MIKLWHSSEKNKVKITNPEKAFKLEKNSIINIDGIEVINLNPFTV